MTMMTAQRQRRFMHRAATTTMTDEEQYFSKEKLLPRRKESFCSPSISKKLAGLNKSGLLILSVLSFLLFVLVIFIMHHFLSKGHMNEGVIGRKTMIHFESQKDKHGEDLAGGDIVFSYQQDVDDHLVPYENQQSLNSRVEELHRIRSSVLVELRQFEKRRQELLQSIKEETKKLELLQNNVNREERQLDNIQNAIEQARIAHREAISQETPEIFLPAKLSPPFLQINSLPPMFTSYSKKSSINHLSKLIVKVACNYSCLFNQT